MSPAAVDATTHASLLQHFARYFDACDRCDIDAVMEIMAGATIGVGDTALSDPDTIRAMYTSRQAAPLADGRRLTKHHVTNLLVETVDGDGDGPALSATVYYFRLQPGESGPQVAASGRLNEVVVRDGDRWRVIRHSIVSDF